MRYLNVYLKVVAIVVSAVAVGGCSRAVAPLVSPGESAVALTGGPNTSMIFLARTSDGVIAVDLGWWGSESALNGALYDLGATPSEVTAVFLTHSHRDHIGGWRVVQHAEFHVAAAEQSRLFGDTTHHGWIPELANRIMRRDLPRAEEITVRTFSRDTFFVVGRDTVRAYPVPGHTAGSAVYLYRGVLFLGDAVTYSRLSGFAPAKHAFSDDARLAARNLRRLWARLPTSGVRYICTAHARCAHFDAHFLRDVAK